MRNLADILLGWFNLRALVALTGAFLLFGPTPPDALHWLDRTVFGLGVKLHNVPAPDLGVSIVELPETEVDYLTGELGRAERTLALLQRVTGSQKIAVGLVLPRPLGRGPSVEGLLQELTSGGEGGHLELDADLAPLKNYLSVSRELRRFTNHSRVVFADASTPVPVERLPSSASEYSRWLPAWMLPALPGTGLPSRAGEVPLLRRSHNDVHPAFALDLYARLNKAESIGWRELRGAQLGPSLVPTSADGSFFPYPHSAASGDVRSLDQALDNRLDNNLILLGPAGSPRLLDTANALRSLDSRTYYRTPFWFIGAELAILLLLCFYLMVLLPRMSYAAGILATSLLLVVLLFAQLGWQITQWQWLPLGIPAQFLLAGHLLMSLWKRQREKSLQLQAAAHGARYQLGLQLFRDGRSDDALLAIKECFTSDAVLGLMYDIGSQQERKRHYGEALKTYQAIVSRRKNFRDAAEKVEKLMAFSSGGASTFSGGGEIAKTLIISESSINKPVLGRYEVERELGRGAMGIVYLGRDPKIAREVAIKTLSYSQLEQKELEEFKQRFFREAEAAGRLNHPNIVTVYDVGEEHDLAFIAMDYVKGAALSRYAGQDDLLPTATVLRLIAEVAEALEYAHGKQVIHRDIKPANIIYQPEDGKVMVTDFGVARIVDSARTSTGDILGSPLYMSPEQLRGDRVDNRTDIYSLGVTLYQLLTAKLPFTGDNLANLTYNIIHEKHPAIRQFRPDLPSGITRIVNKALHKEPEKRYANAADMAAALRKVLEEIAT